VRSRQRVRDAHHRLAAQGFSTGTKVYGYRSVPVYTGGDKPSHVKQEILPEEAHVVRRIFQMYADGYGLKRVARHLNSEGIPAPRSKEANGGWWDGTIRAMLHQELYRGKRIWGRTRKDDRNGRTGLVVKQTPTVTLDRPDLVITDEALWDAVHARLKETRTNYLRDGNGRLLGRPTHSSALLSGLGACGICGGGMIRIVKGGTRSPRPYYACCKNHKQGDAGCSNTLRQRVEVVDRIFLEGFHREVLTPVVTRRIFELAAERLRQEMDAEPSKLDTLKKQQAKVQAEITRLVASIAGGEAPEAVVKAIRDREERQKVLSQEIARLEAAPALVGTNIDAALKEMRKDLDSFGDILRESRPKATLALSKVLDGRLTFQVERGGEERFYRLTGGLRFGKLLDLCSRSTKARNALASRAPQVRQARIFLLDFPGRFG